MFMFLIVLQEA